MPKTLNGRPLTNAEKQARYRARQRKLHLHHADDQTLIQEVARRGLIPTDQPDTGTHTSQEDAR